METPVHVTKLAERLENLFYGTRGYWTTATDKVREDGKKLHETRAIPEEITTEHYEQHLMSKDKGLTVSPLYSTDKVYFGAIDIDTYKWDEQKKLKLLKDANGLNLTPARTKSGGIHLYAFTGEKDGVPAQLMINRLSNARDILELPEKTEIFPKQPSRLKDELGNGITIPFRSFMVKDNQFNTVGLSVLDNKIIENNIGVYCDIAERQTKYGKFDIDFYNEFEKYVDPIETAETIAEKQNISREQILINIRKGVAHEGGGTFDNWVLLYVAKSVKAMETDYEILKALDRVREHSDKADTKNLYFKKKIFLCRKKFGIADPDEVRKKICKRLVYIIDEDKYYDLIKGKSYSIEKIDRSFAQYFRKPTCSNYLKYQSDRVEVENWVWSPKDYDPKNKIVMMNGLRYLNAYQPNGMIAAQGDTKPWNDLLKYIFLNNQKHIDQFLDWLAYQVQHMGTKLRYAILIYTKEFQVGKGSIFRAIQKIFGEHNTNEIDIEQALDHAKAYLRNSAIVCIDEMESTGTFGQKKTLLNVMKRIITAGKLGHRARYSDYDNVPTLTNYILFTNNKDALSLPKNEMRYSVYMHEKLRMPQEWYDNFHQWLDDAADAKKNGNHKNFQDGGRFILHELLMRDVSKFNPMKVAPTTSFNGLMSEAGGHPLASLLKEKFDGNFYPLRKDIVSTLAVYTYLKEVKELGRFRTNDIAKALEFIGGEKLEQVPIKLSAETKRMTLFIIRNHSKYTGMAKSEIGDMYWKDCQLSKETGLDHPSFATDTDVQDSIIPTKKIYETKK